MSTKPFSEILECINKPVGGYVRTQFDKLSNSIGTDIWELEKYLLLVTGEQDRVSYCIRFIDELYEMYWICQAKMITWIKDEENAICGSKYNFYRKCCIVLKKSLDSILNLMGERLKLFFPPKEIEKYQGMYDVGRLRVPECNIYLRDSQWELLNVAKVMRQYNLQNYPEKRTPVLADERKVQQSDLTFSGMGMGKEILQKIFQLLREHKFIAANTSLDAFYYWMGCGSSQNTQDIEPINWIAKLKDLGVWVNVFFGNENKKWEKTIRCFRINGEEIKKRSITTAVDKHDNVDELEHIFKSWKE